MNTKTESSPRVVEKPIVFTSELEKEALWGAITKQLMTEFQHEIKQQIRPECQEEHRQKNLVLRTSALQLSKDLNKELTPVDALWLGLTELIPQEQLEEWANPSEEPHWTAKGFHETARYLIQEIEANQ